MDKSISALIFFLYSVCAIGQAERASLSVSSSQNIETLKEEAATLSQQRKFDSAALYYRKAATAYLLKGDSIQHFLMRNLEAGETNKAGKFQESIEKSNGIIREGGNIKGANILFDAYVNKANRFLGLFQGDSALANYNQAERFYEDLGTPESAHSLAKMYMGRGSMYRRDNALIKATEEYEKAAELFDDYKIVHPNVGVNYYGLAAVAHSMGLIKQTEFYLQKQLDVIALLPQGPGDRNVVLNYKSRGDLANSRHSYQEALELLNYALKTSEEAAPNDFYTPEIKEFLSKAYVNLEKPDLAHKYLKEALEQNIRMYGKNHWYVARDYEYLARYFGEIGQHSEANQYFEKATSLYKKMGPPVYEFDYSKSRLLQGVNLIKSGGDTLKAFDFAYEALRIAENDPVARQYQIMGMYGSFADLFYELGEYDSSTFYYQKALASEGPSFTDMVIQKNPYIANVRDFRTVLSLLTNKAKAIHKSALSSTGSDLLLAAFQTIMSADTLAGELRTRPSIFSDKLSYQARISEINDLGVQINYALYQSTKDRDYLERAFYFAEKDKANLTLFNLQENLFLNGADLPDSIIGRAEDLQSMISYLEAEQFYNQEDSAASAYYANQLLEYRESYLAFLDHLKSSFPNYYEAKYANDYTDIKSLQSQLMGKDRVMISYQINGDQLYIFVIDNDSVSLLYKPLSTSFTRLISQYLIHLSRPGKQVKEFADISRQLAAILLPDEINLSGYKELVIVPDGLIATIPFETLISHDSPEAPDFKGLSYLIKSHIVSYASSGTLLLRQTGKKRHFRNAEVLAFAPSFGDKKPGESPEVDSVRNGLGVLNWTENEVAGIDRFFNTYQLLDSQATEKKFRELSPDYAIVHVASHGLLNEKDPMYSKLVFSPFDIDSLNDGYLNTQEIFNMEIPAEMMVLSACNTGLGEVVSGEGVLSLASGFFYAGSQSLVMTLWTANDQSTAQMIDQFYQNLSRGSSKSQALRDAKLAYLEEADILFSHPYYWAHFVVNGDDRPLIEAGFPKAYWFLLLIPVAFFLISRFKKSSAT